MSGNSELRPDMRDITLRAELFQTAAYLGDESYRALITLYMRAAGKMVWTFEAPTDGVLHGMDSPNAHRFIPTSARRWKNIRPDIEEYFIIKGGSWAVRYPDWIVIGERSGRSPLSASLRRSILERDSYRCLYCGGTAAPFDIDHIVPVAAGGSDDPENLATACAPCNRSKGAKSLAEWAR